MSIAVSSCPPVPSPSAGLERHGAGSGRRLYVVPDPGTPAGAPVDAWPDPSYDEELTTVLGSLRGLALLEAEILSI